jgi:hypothetical protein
MGLTPARKKKRIKNKKGVGVGGGRFLLLCGLASLYSEGQRVIVGSPSLPPSQPPTPQNYLYLQLDCRRLWHPIKTPREHFPSPFFLFWEGSASSHSLSLSLSPFLYFLFFFFFNPSLRSGFLLYRLRRPRESARQGIYCAYETHPSKVS